jgi:multiple sugar transport system ATP-binding protein
MVESGVNIQNVEKEYYDSDVGMIPAVDDVTINVESGEFLSIVGPSGSGKSTILRMIAGLEDITGGTISIDGEVVNSVPPQDRDVAMVFQNYALYPHMNVRKNMSYGLKLTTDLSKDEIKRRVKDAAEMMGIEDLLKKKPSSLSGGQQQRVATGRAIVRNPKVFLMDEPLSNLDAKLRLHMRTELQRIQEDFDTTAIYVTHDQEEAMTMSDRVAVLADGVIQQLGTPAEIYSSPANRFVADFIGNPPMNFIDVDVDGTTLVTDTFTYDITEYADQVYSHNELTLGVRPENIALADQAAEGKIIEAELDVFEHVGSDNYLHLLIGDIEFTIRVPGSQRFEEGEKVELAFAEENIHLFDESGQNITNAPQSSRTAITLQ